MRKIQEPYLRQVVEANLARILYLIHVGVDDEGYYTPTHRETFRDAFIVVASDVSEPVNLVASTGDDWASAFRYLPYAGKRINLGGIDYPAIVSPKKDKFVIKLGKQERDRLVLMDYIVDCIRCCDRDVIDVILI